MNKAIFLDRDGTINVEKHYLYKIEDFEFLPRAIDGLKKLQDAKYKLIIITNQSGIARGYYTEEDFLQLNGWMIRYLIERGIRIEKVYYCPHLPNAKVDKYRKICTCRKPELDLYKQAVKEFDIDLSTSYAIGDKVRDCSICKSTDCKGFLIAENEKSDVIAAVKTGEYSNIKYAQDLFDAANLIVKGEHKWLS